ncbi:MAG: hypothetical protein M3Q68_01425 [Actinomycetota bacterium]|nr:hypothetical protein [Actinomycetota bacterium]
MALHLVCAASLALAWLAFGRIFGAPLYYLMLWGWSIAGLVGLATAWTAVELALGLRPWSAPSVRRHVARAVALSGTLVVVALGLRLATQPRPVELGLAPIGSQLGRLVPATANGLEEAGGRRGRWLVTWTDSAHLGSQGYGLVNELERRGFDVGVVPYHAVNFVPRRLVPEAEAAGRLHLVIGEDVEAWRELPGAQMLAYDDPRTSAERDQFERLRRDLQADFRATGLDDLAEGFDDNLWVSSFDPRLAARQSLRIQEMRDLGVPAAVFVVPVAAGI